MRARSLPEPGDRIRATLPGHRGQPEVEARYGTVVARSESARGWALQIHWDHGGGGRAQRVGWLPDAGYLWKKRHITLMEPGSGRVGALTPVPGDTLPAVATTPVLPARGPAAAPARPAEAGWRAWLDERRLDEALARLAGPFSDTPPAPTPAPMPASVAPTARQEPEAPSPAAQTPVAADGSDPEIGEILPRRRGVGLRRR
ncbi:MAG: hypothetical protein ACRD0M_05310 [Acidimicrobiales bacterium]